MASMFYTFSFQFCISSPQNKSVIGSLVLKELYTADKYVICLELVVVEMNGLALLNSNVAIIGTGGY